MKLFATISLFFLFQTFVMANEQSCLEQEYKPSLNKNDMARRFVDETTSKFITPAGYVQLQDYNIQKEICTCVLYKALTRSGNDYPKTKSIPVSYELVSNDCRFETQIIPEIDLPGVGKALSNYRVVKCRSPQYAIGLSFLKGKRVRRFHTNAYDIYVANIPVYSQLGYEVKGTSKNPADVEKKPDGFYFQGFFPALNIDKFVPKA